MYFLFFEWGSNPQPVYFTVTFCAPAPRLALKLIYTLFILHEVVKKVHILNCAIVKYSALTLRINYCNYYIPILGCSYWIVLKLVPNMLNHCKPRSLRDSSMYFFCISMYPVYSRVGGGNLELIYSCLQLLLNFRNIEWCTEQRNAALYFVTIAREANNFNWEWNRTHKRRICSQTLCCCATTPSLLLLTKKIAIIHFHC